MSEEGVKFYHHPTDGYIDRFPTRHETRRSEAEVLKTGLLLVLIGFIGLVLLFLWI